MAGSERESSSHPEGEQSLTQIFNFQVGDKRLSLTVHKDINRAFTTIRKTGDPYQPGEQHKFMNLPVTHLRDLLLTHRQD